MWTKTTVQVKHGDSKKNFNNGIQKSNDKFKQITGSVIIAVVEANGNSKVDDNDEENGKRKNFFL